MRVRPVFLDVGVTFRLIELLRSTAAGAEQSRQRHAGTHGTISQHQRTNGVERRLKFHMAHSEQLGNPDWIGLNNTISPFLSPILGYLLRVLPR